MKLKEVIKKYSKNVKDYEMLVDWLCSEVCDNLTEDLVCEIAKKAYYKLNGGHYNQEFAEEQIKKMHYGTHYGPYYTDKEITDSYSNVKNLIPDYNIWDFAVTMNMIESDYHELLTKWYPNEDHYSKIVELAVNWLDDSDNPYGTEKAWRYFNS